MRSDKKILKVKITTGPKIHDAKGVRASFDYVFKMVEDGWTIAEALEIAGIERSAFYKHITPEQKHEIQMEKLAHSKIGALYKVGKPKDDDLSEPQLRDTDVFIDFVEPAPDIDWSEED